MDLILVGLVLVSSLILSKALYSRGILLLTCFASKGKTYRNGNAEGNGLS